VSAPTRVVIECTAEGASISVFAGDRLIIDNRWEIDHRGDRQDAPNNVDLEDALEGYPELFAELDRAENLWLGTSEALLSAQEDA